MPWFQDDLGVVRPEFQAGRANRENSVLKSVLYGSLCFRFDHFLSCFLNVLQSESNHFSSFGVFFLVYFLPFFFNSLIYVAF